MKTNETKHTPGEWHRTTAPNGDIQICTVNKGDEPNGIVATVRKASWTNKKEAEANARLLSASPELLESLELFIAFMASLNPGWLGKTTGDIGLLNDAYLLSAKAIAKAKGQP